MSLISVAGPYKPSPFNPYANQTASAVRNSPAASAPTQNQGGFPDQDQPQAMNAKLAEFIRAFIDAAS